MEVVTYLKIIGRYWWLILLTALISTGAAAAIALTKTPSYSVQARVIAKPATSVLTETRDIINTLSEMSMRSLIGTFAQIFTSAEIQTAAQTEVGITAATAKEYPIQANVLPDTNVIEVSAKGEDPRLLANYVNATIDAAVAKSPSLYSVIELQPLEKAIAPTSPTSPIPARDIPIGGGLGLGLGILLALAIEYLRTPRRAEYEPQIRSLVPTNVMPALPSLAPPPATGQQEMRVINGGQQRQEYLLPGRQQRTGWHNPQTTNTNPNANTPSRREDSFPG